MRNRGWRSWTQPGAGRPWCEQPGVGKWRLRECDGFGGECGFGLVAEGPGGDAGGEVGGDLLEDSWDCGDVVGGVGVVGEDYVVAACQRCLGGCGYAHFGHDAADG